MAIQRRGQGRVSWNSGALLLGLLLLVLTLIPRSVNADEPATMPGIAQDWFYTKDSLADYDLAGMGATWAYNYQVDAEDRGNVEYVHMVWRLRTDRLRQFERIAGENPGATWLLGNEPDGHGQANQTPAEYAAGYKAIYHTIKQIDPTAQIFAGGISTVSPLRLAWLDAMLAAYGEPFPADGWHIHPYILPEACAWGLGLPVGIDASAAAGRGCEYADRHGDYSAFVEQIDLFTSWADDRGMAWPIIVSEYGILMEAAHGYDQRRINDYLYATTMYMHNHPQIVRYAWFSANFTALPGQTFDRSTKQLTATGRAYQRFEASR